MVDVLIPVPVGLRTSRPYPLDDLLQVGRGLVGACDGREDGFRRRHAEGDCAPECLAELVEEQGIGGIRHRYVNDRTLDRHRAGDILAEVLRETCLKEQR